ncbi:MAG: DUF1947 domain-containing protein [Candidatus Lokiarchaeota archaeon]|nr:DUF1947 domain-containing protein [Candidatus Lokiarchaeota archaeon]
MNIKQRHFIKSTEIKELKEEVLKQYDERFVAGIFPSKSRIEVIYTEAGDKLYSVNGELRLWQLENQYIPVLSYLLKSSFNMKTIVVDMGAIRFVTNGADIMRPGLRKIDETIKKGDIVRISDEKHDKTLAVGKSLFDAGEMEALEKGKVVKNLHTIKDSVWEFAKEFK